MSFEIRGEAVLGAHALDELKLVYRVLHRHLSEHVALMDTHFLLELQSFLQRQALADGIDPSNHGEWDGWLGNVDAEPCDVRLQRRRDLRASGADD